MQSSDINIFYKRLSAINNNVDFIVNSIDFQYNNIDNNGFMQSSEIYIYRRLSAFNSNVKINVFIGTYMFIRIHLFLKKTKNTLTVKKLRPRPEKG